MHKSLNFSKSPDTDNKHSPQSLPLESNPPTVGCGFCCLQPNMITRLNFEEKIKIIIVDRVPRN